MTQQYFHSRLNIPYYLPKISHWLIFNTTTFTLLHVSSHDLKIMIVPYDPMKWFSDSTKCRLYNILYWAWYLLRLYCATLYTLMTHFDVMISHSCLVCWNRDMLKQLFHCTYIHRCLPFTLNGLYLIFQFIKDKTRRNNWSCWAAQS